MTDETDLYDDEEQGRSPGYYEFVAEPLPSTIGEPMGLLFELLLSPTGKPAHSVFRFLLDKKDALALAAKLTAGAEKLPDDDEPDDEEE